MAQVDRTVFKSYDIRGTYPDQLDERFAYLLGRALPLVCARDGPARRIAVGHDARLSSPSLYAALAAGCREAGADVEGMGLCPTELVYYIAGSAGGPDLGVMITAS
ncbi:MAG: phosphomannomutase, partial [Candidatus Brocadiae bacterium]|nr:phosphomannomutase [Candidatus Brocadiia bacterium]